MARKKVKESETNVKMFIPETFRDLEDIACMLQEKETSILINLSKSKCKKDIMDKMINFILSYNTSYMTIKVKKVFTRVLVCSSYQNKLLF